MARGPGEFDEPEDFEESEEHDEVKHIHRVEDGHEEDFDEHYHHEDEEHFEQRKRRAYEESKARQEAARKKKYSETSAAERVRQGVLKKNYNPHSKRLVAWGPYPTPRAWEHINPQDVDHDLKKKIIEYNNLRKKYVETGTLSHEELLKFRELHQGLSSDPVDVWETRMRGRTPITYKAIEEPGAEGKTPEQLEHDRIQRNVKRDFDVTPRIYARNKLIKTEGPERSTTDLRGHGDRETIEDTISKYGQEELHKKRPKVVSTLSEDEGEVQEPTRTGWEATYRFNRNQYKRKLNALRTGEASLGLGELGSSGHTLGVPVEKAKLTVGPNQENVIIASPSETESPYNWQKVKTDTEPTQDKFVVRLEQGGAKSYFDKEGNYFKEGRSLTDTLEDAGVPVKTNINEFRKIRKHGKTPAQFEYKFHTEAGEHLTPDQIDKLKEALHLHHGLVDFKVEKSAQFKRQKGIVPVGYHKLPKGLKDSDVQPGSYRRNIYSKRAGARLGERDPITDELLPGQKDTLGIRIGPWAGQYHLREDTDAIGWGKSYRPGSKEISRAAMALPRARRNRRISEASQMYNYGYDEPMERLLQEEHPEIETDVEKQEHINKYRQHSKELAAAGLASSYYTAKKGWPRKVGAKVYHRAEQIPKVGSHISKLGESTNLEELFRDADWVKRPFTSKMDRAKYRVLNPLGDPNDPTMAGISWDERKINLPRLRYRSFPIPAQTREGRIWERKAKTLSGIAGTRENINKFLQSDNKNIYKKLQAKSAIVDSAKKTSDRFISDVNQKAQDVASELGKEHVIVGTKQKTMDQVPVYEHYLNKAQDEIDALAKKVAKNPDDYSHEALRDLWEKKYPSHIRTALPRGVKVGGGVGLATAGLVGGSLLAVDRYQTYKHNKGEHINHPILKAVTPERIVVPQVTAKRTREYIVPHNTLTDALDLEGEKIPVAGRISVSKKEKLRLREHTDISGQGYKQGLPILGGVGVTPNAPIKGSIKKTVVHPSSQSGLGPVKNMYVLGHKAPVDITVGRKERWDNKKHSLRAKYNPYKLSAEDREHLVQLAHEAPYQRAQIDAFYHGDKRFQEMRDDPNEVERINKKNRYWLQGGKDLLEESALEKAPGRKGVGVPDQKSMTEEEARDKRRGFESRRRELKREQRARS